MTANISRALQPERASGQRSKAAGVVIGLSKFASWNRFGLVLASIWRMSVLAMARIAPLNPPYATDIQAAFDAIMPAGVDPLVLFRTR